jgi:Tol biopolymer transport system component
VQRRHLAPAVTVLSLLAPVLLVGSMSLGLRGDGQGTLASLPPEAGLDYALRRNSFAPLTERFVGGVLGRGPLDAGGETNPPSEPAGVRSAAPITIEHPFTNDDFSKAYVVPSVPFTAKTNTASASREGSDPDECAPVGGTAWYRFTPPTNVRLIASTIGSGYTTALAVFSGGKLEGCARDAQGNSLVAFRARAGVTYDFQITGPVNGGPLVFNLLADGATTRASVGFSGEEGSATSQYSVISSDGRFVAFNSYSNFTGEPTASPPGDGCWMVTSAFVPDPVCPLFLYLRDRATHQIVFTGRNLSNQAISKNSRYLVFVGEGSGGPTKVLRYDRKRRETLEVSVSSSGEPANSNSGGLISISADGRYVAFESRADNLVPNDGNAVVDVFVRDMVKRTTTRVSMSSAGEEGNASTSARFCSSTACEIGSHLMSISSSGRWVAFRSASSNLVPDDTNRAVDVFVHDMITGRTERVSVSSTGEEANADTLWAHQGSLLTVSDNGRFVVFNSFATNLVPRDTNGVSDVFVRDRVKRTTRLVTVSSDGDQANSGRGPLSAATYYMDWVGFGISPDGRYATFDSIADNLVDGDTNEQMDVFVRDLEAGVTVRMSVSSDGEQSAGYSYAPSISADGRFVHFLSDGGDLVADDTNGVYDVFVHEIANPGRSLSDWY